MKQRFWIAIWMSAILLSGCATSPSPSTAAAATSTQTSSAPSPSSETVTASVVVAPVVHSQLSFLIQATVKEVKIKEGDQVQAGQSLVVLDTPESSLAVDAAQAAVRSAQAVANLRRYPHKMLSGTGNIVYLSGPPELKQVADAQLQQAQSALEAARVILAQGNLLAPYQGTVVTLNVVQGQLVQPGQIVAVIGELDHLQIETTDLPEKDISRVQIGQTAVVHLKAFGQPLSGKVIAIAPRANISDGKTVFQVTIELDAPPPNLLWGLSGTVEIQTK
jgi:multidrug resistance efflux pump